MLIDVGSLSVDDGFLVRSQALVIISLMYIICFGVLKIFFKKIYIFIYFKLIFF